MKGNSVRLRHMLEAIINVEKFTDGMARETFVKDEKSFSAVIYQFHIIGEALNHIDDEFRGMYLDLPVGDIIGLRNKIVHEYFGISRSRIWKMIQNDLPKLKEQVMKAIEETE